jgi:hypothetical protein
MPRFLGRAAGVAIVLAAAHPACAGAVWSPARSVPGTSHADWTQTAINARGDVTVAWADETRVRVASQRAGTATFQVQTVFTGAGRRIADVALALDRFGEATVAWVDAPRTGHATIVVRAAYRRPGGAWTHPQVIGRSTRFSNALPSVATSPGGTVVLTYNADIHALPGVAAAWRSRGHAFGRVRAVGGKGALTEPTLAFDATGTAYLAGTSCSQRAAGLLYTARNGRFGPARTIARPPATGIGFAVTGPQTAVATWIGRPCNAGEDIYGLPMAATIDGATVHTQALLGVDLTSQIVLARAALPATAVATWNVSSAVLYTSTLSRDGNHSPPAPPQDGWSPVAGDSEGNQLLRQIAMPDLQPFAAVSAQPADGGAPEAAPLQAAGWPWTAGTAAATTGAGLALTTVVDRHVAIAIWRP